MYYIFVFVKIRLNNIFKGGIILEKVYIEPAGRLLMSIGRDLIKDTPAALVELVKNSYDADATKVDIQYIKEKDKLTIIVEDDGHGMSRDNVVNAWMTPATNYKLRTRKSPKGRVYQGRKGIGRYAVSLLGNKLKLTTAHNGKKTTALFDWNKFERAEKLSDVPISLKVEETAGENYTKLTIINDELDSNNSERDILGETDSEKIEKELSKLLSGQFDFKIKVSYVNFFQEKAKNTSKYIKQYASDLVFHYRLFGYVNANFEYQFYYVNSYDDSEKEFSGSFYNKFNNASKPVSCGDMYFDYKVYDKDSEGIELITDFLNNRGDIKPLTNRETKNLLANNSGISIYRNSFRIRPYGDKGFDWLNLDSQRVQRPTMHIGFDQINGRIEISSEEISGLKEKSARDGLYENENYFVLQKLADYSLEILEKERLIYRQSIKKKTQKKPIDKLFDFTTTSSNIEKQIQYTFDKLEANPSQSKKIFENLQKVVSSEIDKLEKEKQESFKEIKEEVAIYQKHTTLGSVINVVLHEGRKPLVWYRNTIPKLIRKFKKVSKNENISTEIIVDSIEALKKLESEANRLSRFFKRLDPLSSARRKKEKVVSLKTEIENVLDIFTNYALEKEIKLTLYCPVDLEIRLVEEDLYMALTNLIENSIFWVAHSKKEKKEISVSLEKNNDTILIDIMDNGPGIPEEDIKSEVIFIPGYSGKKTVIEQGGTGLGLAIAGEAISRNNGVLEAVNSVNGAHFRIKF